VYFYYYLISEYNYFHSFSQACLSFSYLSHKIYVFFFYKLDSLCDKFPLNFTSGRGGRNFTAHVWMHMIVRERRCFNNNY
jgi:hypothetical protein